MHKLMTKAQLTRLAHMHASPQQCLKTAHAAFQRIAANALQADSKANKLKRMQLPLQAQAR
jgi:hypothetical protein